MEIWRPVSGYEGLYEVSNQGRVRSFHKSIRNPEVPRILAPGNVRGYRQVCLRKNGENASGLVHRLVALAFVGHPPTPDHQVNHKDFNKANNVPENLEWVTQAENNIYSKDVIPRNRGEANHSKLTEKQVIEMRRRHRCDDISYAELGRIYGVSLQTCSAIIRRKKWRHVP